jgi:hypothetical protein
LRYRKMILRRVQMPRPGVFFEGNRPFWAQNAALAPWARENRLLGLP